MESPVTHPAQHTGAIHDVMAAELLASAARTSPEAKDLKGSLNSLLGAAYIHHERCKRLNDAAVQATLAGAHDAAAVIGRAAAEELEAAIEHEAVVSGAVRGMHSFGFMTADEQKFIQRKKFEEGMTASQAEDVFSKMLDNMFQSAANYGVDEDGFGAEGEAEEPDEIEGDAAEQLGALFAALGGDFPLVFGADSYARFGVVFGASVERLKKRRARLRSRLKKLQEKLETLEGAGKSGLRVRFLQRRVDKLEKRIEKISTKIEAAGGAKADADDSEDRSDEVKAAEESAAKSAAKGGDDDAELDGIEALASELDGDESETDEGDDDEKDEEEDEEISGLVAEVSLFGASERRANRLKRRVIRMEARLNKLLKRRRGLLKNVRVRRLKKRIAALKAKLESMDEALPQSPAGAPAGGSYVSALTSPILSAYKPDQYLSSYKGSLNVAPEIAEREPYVQFFRRKAEAMGSLNIDMESFGAANEGFFAKIATFFRETFTAEGRKTRAERRARAQEYVKARAEQLDAKRAAATEARRANRKEIREAREAGQTRGQIAEIRKGNREEARERRKDIRDTRQDIRAARRAGPPEGWQSGRPGLLPSQSWVTDRRESQLSPGLWREGLDYTFVVDEGMKIFLVKPGNTEAETKLILVPDQEGARRNLTNPNGRAMKAIFTPGRRWRDAVGNVFAVSDDGDLYLDQSVKGGKLSAPVRIPNQGLAQMKILFFGDIIRNGGMS